MDGTAAGNMTRYVNHSCAPNCEMVMRLVAGRRRLFLFSRRALRPGDELSYDYKLSAPDTASCLAAAQQGEGWQGEGVGVMVGRAGGVGEAVRCRCGAPHCRGFL
jgi:SET domain-containing protein